MRTLEFIQYRSRWPAKETRLETSSEGGSPILLSYFTHPSGRKQHVLQFLLDVNTIRCGFCLEPLDSDIVRTLTTRLWSSPLRAEEFSNPTRKVAVRIIFPSSFMCSFPHFRFLAPESIVARTTMYCSISVLIGFVACWPMMAMGSTRPSSTAD